MNISTLLKLIYIVNIILTKEININDNSQTIHKKFSMDYRYKYKNLKKESCTKI